MAFAEVLRGLRKQAGLTQEALAEAADFEASYLSMLETGSRQPTITTIIALEQALGAEAGELIKKTVTAMQGKRLAHAIHGTGKGRKVRRTTP